MAVKLTKSELEVMNTIWQEGRALARNEIIELCVNPSWSPNTIHALLNGLIRKGMIREAGFVKRNKTYGRLYAAKVSGEDYYASTLFAEQNTRAIPIYFSALLRNENLTEETVAEMEAMLAERKKKAAKKEE